MKKRILKILIPIVFAFVIVLVLFSPPAMNYYKSLIESQVYEKTGIALEIGEVGVSRLPWRLSATGIHAKMKDGMSVSVDSLKISPDILKSLLQRSFVISALDLKGIKVVPAAHSGSSDNSTALAENGADTALPCDIHIPSITVEQIQLNDLTSFPLESLIFRGDLSCTKEKGIVSHFTVTTAEQTGKALLAIQSDIVDGQRQTKISVEERDGGVILSHFLGEGIENAQLKAHLDAKNQGKAVILARGGGENPWTMHAKGHATLGSVAKIDLENTFEGRFKGTQDLRVSYYFKEQTFLGQLKGSFEDNKHGVFQIDGTAKGPLKAIKGSAEAVNETYHSKFSFDFKLSDLVRLSLKNIVGSWKDALVEGQIFTNLETHLTDGHLEFKHLDSFQELFLDKPYVAGKIDGNIHLSHVDGKQNGDVHFISPRLAADGAVLQNASIHLVLNDLFDAFLLKLSGKIQEMAWNKQHIGMLTVTTQTQKEGQWPFKISIVKAPDSSTSIDAQGTWRAQKNKFSFHLDKLSGMVIEHIVNLQRPFNLNYENKHLDFSPLFLQLNESKLYIALNEVANNYELCANLLNFPSSLLKQSLEPFGLTVNDQKPSLWNFKGRLHWAHAFDQMKLTLAASNKESPHPTIFSASLQQNTPLKAVACKWEILHPSSGLLALYKDNLQDLAFQIHSEWTLKSSSLMRLLFSESIPELSGHSSFNYTFGEYSGEAITHISKEDHILRLIGINAKNQDVEANGHLSYNIVSGETKGTLSAKGISIPAEAEIQLAGPLYSLEYTAKLQYSETKDSPVAFTTDGHLTADKLTGKAEGKIPFSDTPILAKAEYQILLDKLLTTKLELYSTLSSNDSRKVELNTVLEGPLTELRGQAKLSGQGLRLEGNVIPDWAIVSQFTIPAKTAPFTFTIDNKANGNGSWAMEPNGFSLQLAKLEGNVNDQKLVLNAPWKIEWKESKIHVEPLQLSIGQGSLKLDGDADKEAFKLFVKGKDLPFAMIIPGDETIPVSGKINIEGNFDGPWSAPQGLLHVAAEDVQFVDKYFGKAPNCHAALDLALKPSKLTVQGEVVCPSIEPITLTGAIPLSVSLIPFDASLDKNAPLDVNFKVAGALGPVLDIFLAQVTTMSGYLTLSVQVQGTVTKPVINGLASFDQGSFENLETGTILNNISFKARANGTQVIIENISATDKQQGRLSGNGKLLLDLEKGYPFEIATRLDKLLLVQTDVVRSAFDGDITFKGDKSGAVIAGSVQPYQGMLYIPEEIPEGTETVECKFVNIPKDRQRKTYETKTNGNSYPITLDLNVNAAHRVHILGRGLESTWKGQTHVSGPLTNPSVQGEIKIINGTYLFKGRIFEIHQGSISFAGPWETKTKLYVIASLEIDDIMVEAILRGQPKNPSLSFRSNPPMPQRDIVSFLLFGKGASEISPYQGTELSRSISNLKTGDDAPDILSRVRTSLNIDRLDINREVTSQGDKVSVQVGKYINKYLYISLNKSITDDSNSIAVDAKVTKNVKARAQITDNAETQLLLKWKHDF